MPDHDRHPPELKIANRHVVKRPPGSRPMGDIPVVVRLVLEDGTETWRIASANRWTSEHVLVIWRNDPDNPYSGQSCWLEARDVARAFTGPTEHLAALWRQLPRGAPARPSSSGEG